MAVAAAVFHHHTNTSQTISPTHNANLSIKFSGKQFGLIATRITSDFLDFFFIISFGCDVVDAVLYNGTMG